MTFRAALGSEFSLNLVVICLPLACLLSCTTERANPEAPSQEAQNPARAVFDGGRMHRGGGHRGPAFVSKKATEATLTFSHRVLLVSATKPSRDAAQEQIHQQLEHLFGPMERAEYSGVPKEDQKVMITGIVKQQPIGVYEIAYDYTGTIVIEKGPKKYIDLLLPKNPSTIYAEAMVGSKNPCTDDHYQSEGDFWYFWSPAPTYPHCKLKEGVDYDVVRGSIERIEPDSKTTYPEYNRLAQNGVIDEHVFIGLDEPEHGHNPNTSRDINATTYRKMREQLVDMGYKLRNWEPSEIRKIVKIADDKDLPFVEELSKEFPSKGLTIRVRMFFGEIGIDEKSRAFHFFYRDALERSALMVYDGHSGLGGHLDLDAIQKLHHFKIALDQKHYQIYFFNSCTSYTYYNSLYFQRKRSKGTVDSKGTKNLDILANGLSTAFDTMGVGDLTMIRAVDLWAERGSWTSYQKIARGIDSDNLFTINGDEDNPTSPVRE